MAEAKEQEQEIHHIPQNDGQQRLEKIREH